MALLIFFIISALLALSVFSNKNRSINYSAASVYSLIHISLSVYAYMNLNSPDSVYYKFDSLGIILNGLLSLILIPVFWHSRYYLERYIPDRKMKGRFISLIIILSTALSSIYFADNIVIVWVSLEITTVAVTFLIYHERYPDALEAAWKFLFISSFGIVLAFIGILLLSVKVSYAQDSALSYTHLQAVAHLIDPLFMKAAFLLLVTGYSIKMNIFPLYPATVDAKTIAPFPVNALTSTAVLNGGFVAIFRLYSIISGTESAEWANRVLLIIGMTSLVIMSVQLFKVKRFSRMFAYSSMEHMALVIIALSLGKPGLYAAILHIMLHSLAKTGIFLHYGQIRAYYRSGWIPDSGDYMKQNGFSALVYILGLMTATAVPPSGLFVSEYLILRALFSEGYSYIAIAIIVLLSVVMYVIFKYSMQLLYGKLPDNFQKDKAIINKYEPVSQIILFGLVFYLAYFTPDFIKELMNSIVQNLN